MKGKPQSIISLHDLHIQTIKWFRAQMVYKSKKSTIIPNLKNYKFLYFYIKKWAMLVIKHGRMKLVTFRTEE
jgi:hypothetical protein